MITHTDHGLGSVRQMLGDAGVPLDVVNYDPWGAVESGSVPTFGFTGEVQDSAAGLVYLRAWWYDTNSKASLSTVLILEDSMTSGVCALSLVESL